MLVASLILLAIGLAMFVRGMVGRRVGTEPRCRKCKYDLTNLTSDRCPECGVVLGPGAIRTGLRRRRRLSLGLGASAIILAGAWLAPIGLAKIRAVNWYHALPSAWVYSSAVGGSPKAVAVLADRYERGRLDKSLIGRIANTALARQAKPVALFFDPWLDDLLGPMYVGGDLSDAQIELFYRQLLGAPSITVRPKIRSGDVLPVEVLLPIRAPRGLPISVAISLKGANELTKFFPPRRSTMTMSGGRTQFPTRLPVLFESIPPGHHQLRFQFEADLSIGANLTIDDGFAGGLAPGVVNEINSTLEAEFDVVRAHVTDPLDVVRGPEVDEAFRTGLEVRALCSSSGGSSSFHVIVRALKRLPADGVVRIFVRDKSGTEVEYGTLSPGGGGYSISGRDFGLKPGDRATIRVRGDPELARDSLNTFKAWDGEVVFSDVLVESTSPAQDYPQKELLKPGQKLPTTTRRATTSRQTRAPEVAYSPPPIRVQTSQPELQPVTDPQIEDALRRAISFGIVKTVPSDPSARGTIRIDSSTTSMPCDVTFDIFVRCGPNEQEVGMLVLPKGSSMPASRDERPLDPGCRDGTEITIVLRPNPERAKFFGDRMTEYWANEMVFGPFQLIEGAGSNASDRVLHYP